MLKLVPYHTIQSGRVTSGPSGDATMASRIGITPRKPWPSEPSVMTTAASQYSTEAIVRFICSPAPPPVLYEQ